MKNNLDDILNSTEGMQRAQASPFLYGKIMEQLKHLPQPVYYTGKVLVRVAFAMMLIGALNAITLRAVNKQTAPRAVNEEMELHRMAQEYFGFENTNGYLY